MKASGCPQGPLITCWDHMQACPHDDLGHKDYDDRPLCRPARAPGSQEAETRVMVLLNTRCPFSRREAVPPLSQPGDPHKEWAAGAGQGAPDLPETSVPSPSRWDPAQLPSAPNPLPCAAGRLDLCSLPPTRIFASWTSGPVLPGGLWVQDPMDVLSCPIKARLSPLPTLHPQALLRTPPAHCRVVPPCYQEHLAKATARLQSHL